MNKIVSCFRVIMVVGAIAFTGSPLRVKAQGDLTPPGAPIPTMKSLDQIEPRTPISSLPYTISSGGSYYLVTNLTGINGSDGITVGASDATVDLNGFSLIGVPGSKSGILISRPHATIKNGNIHHWGTNGIAGQGILNTVIRSVNVSSNGASGLDGGVHGLVESCISEANTVHGITVGNGTTVRNCAANRNGQTGVNCYSTGTFSSGSIITGCTIAQNTTGINPSANALVSGNDLVNNSFAGVSFAAQGGRVENNHFAYNYNGIDISGYTNLVIHNSFTGSTNTAILGFSATLPIGPLVPAVGVATNNNPNANFLY